jgi:hypothetical protein
MAASRKGNDGKPRLASQQIASRKKLPRGPWKQSWNILWGFMSLIGEVVLIFLVKGEVVSLSTVQIVVIFICIPIVAHLLVSAVRSILIAISF